MIVFVKMLLLTVTSMYVYVCVHLSACVQATVGMCT